VQEVLDHLVGRAAGAIAAGVDPSHIALDPGIGFGKTVDHNLRLLSEGVRTLAATGYPVLVGASRKSFLGEITGEAEAAERIPESISAHALAIAAGASIIRTHDVASGLRSSLVATAIVRGVVEQ
jgi:dihydropteroate synthase